MIEFYRSLEAIEKLIILAVIAVVILFVFSVYESSDIYQECIDSGLHDDFECYSLIYGN
tara:strand:+ start:164 stop:340 length:177 start_codon:yes stop_codon:yes gene_type:complete